MTTQFERFAHAIAQVAHNAVGQKRKYTGEDYIVHPEEVVAILKAHGVTDESIICAAYLHDVLEDTRVTYSELEFWFGNDVAMLVWDVTDQCHEGNRAARKKAEAERLGSCCFAAKMIKLADMISNTKSIVEHDKDFAKVYMREKKNLLDEMYEKTMDEQFISLYMEAALLVNDYFWSEQ